MYKLIPTFIITITLLLGYNFRNTFDHKLGTKGISPLKLIQEKYSSNLDQYFESISLLHTISQREAHIDTVHKQLQSQFIKTKIAYKKVEFLVDYLDNELINKYINGAPLPKLMKHVPEISIIEPNGLQRIDEILFFDSPFSLEEAKLKIDELYVNSKKAHSYFKSKPLQHRFIIESARYGILRIFTLGLAGFDSPGNNNAINEAITSLSSIKESLTYYETIDKKEAADILTSVNSILAAMIDYLEVNTDFDSLDRMFILRSYVNPFYEGLLDFHKSSGIELPSEVDKSNNALNYQSREIFTTELLNKSFFTKIANTDLEKPEIIKLGKTLFFDPILSKDVNMACASCHDPQKGFTDNLPKSKTNTEGLVTQRNSPTLLNSAYYGRYFWDMREYDLERQIKHVMNDKHEFNIDFIDLADRLKESSEYQNLFKEAYGERDKYGISTWSISNSLAAYVSSLSSFDSQFDKYARGESEDLEPTAIEGFNLFMGKAACGTCHFAPTFSGVVPPFYRDSESEVLGIVSSFDTLHPVLDDDPGRIANALPEEEAAFYLRSMKTVTVRNAALTMPYMHNGGLKTLEEVVHFYNKGGGAGLGLEVPYQTLPPDPLGLNDKEINAIVSFMESLTDTVGMTSTTSTFPIFENHPEWNDRSLEYNGNE